MINDLDISGSWTKFEDTLLREIAEATGLTEGRNLFLGHLPSRITNAVALYVSGGDAEQTLAGCYGTLRADVRIFGRFSQRSSGTDFIGLILKHFSEGGFKETGNLVDLYLESMPSIESNMVQVGLDPDVEDSLHCEVEFTCEAFFSTTNSFS